MKAFRAFWYCALENGKTSAEDVWRGALEYILRGEIVEINGSEYINVDRIKKELED